MVVVHIGLEHLLQLPVGLLDVCLVLLQLDIDLVHFIAHGVVLGEDFVQLLAEVSEQLAEEAGVLLDLFDVELVHDLGQRVQHRAGVIQLGQVHAVEYHVGALGDLVCCSGAEGDNGLQVVYLDLAGQGVHLRRVDQRLGHHLPVGGDVVLLIALFFLGGGRCLSLRGLRLGWGRSAEIQAHKSYTPSK